MIGGSLFLYSAQATHLVILRVAEADDLHSHVLHDIGEHVHHSLVFGVLSEETLVPNFGNVVVNCNGLANFGVAVDEVWQVGELEAKINLVVAEPLVGSCVSLHFIVDTAVRQLVPDVGSQTTNEPVTKCWPG